MADLKEESERLKKENDMYKEKLLIPNNNTPTIIGDKGVSCQLDLG